MRAILRRARYGYLLAFHKRNIKPQRVTNTIASSASALNLSTGVTAPKTQRDVSLG
jgi:hypothetical protein